MSFKTEVKFVQGLNEEITFHVGKSAAGNFEIIDNADENDLWFHIDNESSAHVVASIPENMDRKKLKYIVKQGAILCKQNSRFKKVPTDVIYTKIKNIEKTSIVGMVRVTDGKIVRI